MTSNDGKSHILQIKGERAELNKERWMCFGELCKIIDSKMFPVTLNSEASLGWELSVMAYIPQLLIRVVTGKYFFLFLLKNICCGYSLEVPLQGTSYEYHNICFCGEIRKISIL